MCTSVRAIFHYSLIIQNYSWHTLCFDVLKTKTITTMEENKIKDENINEQELNQEATAENETAETETTAEETAQESVEEKDPLEAAHEEIEELKKQMLYKVAEFDNYRKRSIKEKADLILNGGEKTITALLPVLDDFERAIANNSKSDDIEAIKEGMDLIYKKFVKILEGQGVKAIDTKDADFNVDYHEAVAKLPMGEEKSGKVIDCVQTGYTLNDKVIRYAKVAVGE